MAVTIGKGRLPRDDIDRVAALLHHQARGSIRKFSIAVGGDWPVSAWNARLELSQGSTAPPPQARSPTV